MQNLFLNFAGPRFADRHEILAIARKNALRIAREPPETRQIILFGSFTRADYSARSDLDLLVVLSHSEHSPSERCADFLAYVSDYPTDILVLTQAELELRKATGDPFLGRILEEGILLYPELQDILLTVLRNGANFFEGKTSYKVNAFLSNPGHMQRGLL